MTSTYEDLRNINDWADFWRNDIGVNVIPANTRKKETYESWKEWQDKPIPEDLHQEWKSSGSFNNGLAIILGKVHHNRQKNGLYLIGIDCDNSKAVEEICLKDNNSISLSQLAQWTLVEQHEDEPEKAHVLIYSHKPFPKKSSDNNGHLYSKLSANEVPAIEVKGLGSHGILFVTPSIHKNGQPYKIIGRNDPVVADDFVIHIDNICKKYSIPYLEGNGNGNGNGNGSTQVPIQELFKSDFTIFEGHNRHEALMRAMESLLVRNSSILSQDQIKSLAREWNNQHCSRPLDDKEFEKQWKCATDFIGKKKTNNLTTNSEQEERQEQENEDIELAAVKLTQEDLDFALNTIIKEAKYDELSIKQIFHGFNSTFTKTPIPHVINLKNSGAGKSYLLNHVASFYPDKYILTLAGISDKAIFHSDGPMVIEDELTGEIKLLDPVINDLETKIERLQEEDPKKNKERIEEIESEIKTLNRSAQKLIDLNSKIIILQDTPPPTVFNLLMTLLSQDSPKDQLYAFTDKTSGAGKLIQIRNRIRAMPVIFTTQVIDDTDSQRFEEKNRRFIHVTPNTSKEKIREANRLTALKYGYLKDEYDKLVVNRVDIAKAKQIVRVVIAKLKQHTKYLESKDTGVKVPFALTILKSLPDDGRVWEMTVAERTMKYLSMVTKLNMDNRPRVVDKGTGAFYPIATFDDLKETLVLMERGGSNLRPYLAEWYDTVFFPAYEEQKDTPKTAENDIGIKVSETVTGVTTEELATKTTETMKCPKPSIEDIRKKYLDPLVNQGIINKDPSRINNKRNIYSPVNKDIHYHHYTNRDETGKVKIKVSKPDLFPTKGVLEQSFDKVFGYDEDGVMKNNKVLIDKNGHEITLDELLETYFSNPDEYFSKAYTEEKTNG